jgi:hypothetical protein
LSPKKETWQAQKGKKPKLPIALRKVKVSLYFIKTKEFVFGTGYLVNKLGGNFLLGA